MTPGPHKRRTHNEPEDEGWLITFADMCVLLMCFFVLLFGMSSPNLEQMKKVAEALRDKGFYDDSVQLEDPYETLKKKLVMTIGASGYDKFIAASESDKGIDVELSSGAFFEPGSAKFAAPAMPMLEMVAAQVMPLSKEDVILEIEGHTDDSPVRSEQYPSNWELSSARASNVVRFLAAKGFPQHKMKAIGRAASAPKAPNRDAAGTPIPANQDLNRRVVVRLIKGADSL